MIGLALAFALTQAQAGPWTKYQSGPHELVVRFFETTGPAYTRRYATRAGCERARQAIVEAAQDRQQRNPRTNLPEPFTACVPL